MLAELPDRFNQTFAERGWILYDFMNLEVAKTALAQAEAGDLDRAEMILVDYYDSTCIKQQLWCLKGVKAFQPRMRLALKAAEDYEQERYHACIPVVLALLDGFVSDVHEDKCGFFSDNVCLEAWDSIAAHNQGLGILTRVLGKGRRKTYIEQITVPYRHGIMHGRDLGYDNKLVAAKAWAALFATRDWAIRVERETSAPPVNQPRVTMSQLFKNIWELEQRKKTARDWGPRTIRPGYDVPTSGPPEAYEVGTPERILVEYLTWWKQLNYGNMSHILPNHPHETDASLPALVRGEFSDRRLQSYELSEIRDLGPGISEIIVNILYDRNGQQVRSTSQCRLLYEDIEGNLTVRGTMAGKWVLYNWHVL